MSAHAKTYLGMIVLVALGAFAQQSRWFALAGVNPNMLLASLAVTVFLAEGLVEFLLLAVCGAALLKVAPGFEIATLGIGASALLMWVCDRWLPWHAFINMVLGVVIGTIVFYGIVDYRFMTAQSGLLMREIVYNALIAGVLYSIIRVYYAERSRRLF